LALVIIPGSLKVNMKKIISSLVALLFFLPLFAQEKQDKKSFEVTAGYSMLFYQSAYNLQNASGIEASIGREISDPLRWQAGLRVGLDPLLPEVFGRILLQEEVGSWRPQIGLELGVTGRAKFEDGAFLLRETREAMQTGIDAGYLAIHTAPLSFRISKNWNLSIAEIDFGTHFTRIGRTLRAQVTLISAGMKF